MMNDSFGPVGPTGVRYPIHRMRQIRSLVLPVCIVLVLVVPVTVSSADENYSQTDSQSQDNVASPQTECPVMTGNKIDPGIYTDYQEERVFFCCQSCKASFAKDPEKYLSRLPQFASSQTDLGHDGHEDDGHAHGISLFSLAKPTGILTLSLVAITVCLGSLRRLRRLKPRLLLKLHKISGLTALISGVIHASIVILTH